MRILDEDRDSAINNVILMLTINEAMELRDSIDAILDHKQRGDHQHVDDNEFKHEITVAIYDHDLRSTYYFDQFSKRTQKLILDDK